MAAPQTMPPSTSRDNGNNNNNNNNSTAATGEGKNGAAACADWRDAEHMQINGGGGTGAEWHRIVKPVDVCDLAELPYGFSEQAIVTGYRKPYCSLCSALLSAVYPLNNETVNFWTHFVPFWYFAGALVAHWSDVDFRSDPYHWPFLVYLCTVCMWPLVSALAHLLNVLSLRARHLAYFCDYASLSWYSMGCGLAYHAYSFDRRFFESRLSVYFPWLTAASAVMCVTCACASRLMDRRHFWRRKFVRSIGFVLPYVLVNAALFVRIWWHSTQHDPAFTPTAILAHRRQFMSTGFAFLVYNAHIPERLAPGLFDVFGNSHQLFHVLGVAATYYQMHAIADDLLHRRAFFELSTAHAAVAMRRAGQVDIVVCICVLVANVALVAHFINRPQAKVRPAARKDGDKDD